MSTEEKEYTCNYGPYKMYDQSGNEVEVKRQPLKLYEELDIDEIKKFVKKIEINTFKNFSEKIEKRLNNKLKTE